MATYKKVEEANPFFVDDDDDEHWNSNSRKPNRFDDGDQTLEQLVAKKQASEQRQIESLNRSLVVMHETEDIGCQTAEELVRQGEQLNNTQKNLESINAMTKVTQRQLNSIKSVFGGIKNWFQSKSDQPQSKPEIPHSKLKEDLTNYTHFEDLHTSQNGRTLQNGASNTGSASTNPVVESQLGMLSDGIARLKGLGLGMQDELKRQNEQIDYLNDLTETNDALLTDQTRQTRRMLK